MHIHQCLFHWFYWILPIGDVVVVGGGVVVVVVPDD